MQPPAGYAPELVRLSSHGVDVLELGLRGDQSGAPLVFLCGAMALGAAAAGPLVALLAVIKNMRALIPPPASTLVVMAGGFIVAGLSVAAMLAGLAWWIRQDAIANEPGALTLTRQPDGAARLVRLGKDQRELWSAAVADPQALRIKVEEVRLRTGRLAELSLVRSDGRALGPRQGTLLARTKDLAEAQAFGASAQAALERWQRGEAQAPGAQPASR